MSTSRQEFIVTLKDYNFLENFYHDMETEGTTKSFGHFTFKLGT
jgi:hypothetical protein